MCALNRRRVPGVWRHLLLLWAFLVTACGTVPKTPTQPAGRQSCLDFYQALEQEVATARVGDAGAHSVAGYPYLRLNRFLASFRDELTDETRYRSWLAALADTDLSVRRLELANLNLSARQRLAANTEQDVAQRLTDCSLMLRGGPDYHSPDRKQLLQAAQVPDSYSTWQRVLGLYPLARLPALGAVERLHQRLGQPFLEQPELQGRLIVYRPAIVPSATGSSGWRSPGRLGSDPLGIPTPAPAALQGLFQRHAPILEIDTLNANDRIGRIHWMGAGQPAVDTTDPVVYLYPSYTRFQRQTLLQLNYLFWFPARDTGDIYAGQLDSVLWRVTLDRDLSPIAYDSIHGCGCYYQIFPASGYQVRDLRDSVEPVFSPLPAPTLGHGQRLRLRLAAGNHYLQRVTATTEQTGSDNEYLQLDYDRLRSLPLPGGGRRSLFTEQGLVPGSERPERFLLWPFGVRSAGAMRQSGTHAIAFIGRRHFDAPFLLDQLLATDP